MSTVYIVNDRSHNKNFNEETGFLALHIWLLLDTRLFPWPTVTRICSSLTCNHLLNDVFRDETFKDTPTVCLFLPVWDHDKRTVRRGKWEQLRRDFLQISTVQSEASLTWHCQVSYPDGSGLNGSGEIW